MAGTKTLKEKGIRATSQRSLIMEIIQKNRHHLDAGEIYQIARKKEPRISLSTVYRALRAFKERGLVEEVHFDDTHHHYEAKATQEHHHLVCLGCGKVIEFQHPLSRYLNKHVPEARGFYITATEMRIDGYCSACQQKQPTEQPLNAVKE